ncbi:MAG: aldehyde dehydrogenase family protein [Candidatus Nanopelagicales bacterium]
MDIAGADTACFIDGRWVTGAGSQFTAIDPSTENPIVSWVGADAAQVEEAVVAARRTVADRTWSGLAPDRRAAVLDRLADLIEQHSEELALSVVAEVGSPITLARTLQVAQPAANLRWCAEMASRGPMGGLVQQLPALPANGSVPASSSLLVREPIGVVAAMTPYNYPINMLSWKVGPALAAGCSVVALPSPRGTLCSIAFVRLAEEAGVPAGVLALVPGGAAVGEQLAAHPDVDLVTFTGSNSVGAHVMQLAAPNATKVVLELGGKSPTVILPSADLAAVVGPSILRFCRNAGQGCGATTRILVPRPWVERFVELARRFIDDHVPTGDPRLETTEVGPLISEEHLGQVTAAIERAETSGATVAVGGRRLSGRGFYLEPTLVVGAEPDAELSQEELFAPVAVVLAYDSVDEAVGIANSTRYGLNAVVWGDLDQARAVAERIESGTVAINGGGAMRPDVPWTGFRTSGIGSDMGEDGYREFFRVKHLQWPQSPPSGPPAPPM